MQTVPTPADMATEALLLARSDVTQAEDLASRALAQAREVGDARGHAMAERALGLAARERSDIAGSERHLRSAIAVATRAGIGSCVAAARMTLSGTLVMKGDWEGALRQADLAETGLRGVELARLRVQRASVLLAQGRLDEALDGYRLALPALRRADDAVWLARLYSNRGLAHLQRGALSAAEADLSRAEELNLRLNQHRSAAHARQYLGLVSSLRGDLPSALASFDQVDAYLQSQGLEDATFLDMRCVALVAARLVSEARATAERAVRLLAQEKRAGYLATARLRLAEAALLDGDYPTAAATAALAQRAFLRQHRPAFAARARELSLRAAWLSGERSPALLRSAQATAAALADAGFAVEALGAEILVVQLALDLGRRDVARATLARARQGQSRGPVQLRSRVWHVEALLRLSDGDRRGAEAALRAGMKVIERYRAALGATELRAEASGHVSDLAQLGIHLALEDANPRRVLAWAERWKAGSMRLRPSRPPDDAKLADDLAALRAVVADLESGTLSGDSRPKLVARQARLEEAVRSRSRHATGVLAASLAPAPSVDTLLGALGERALVEFTCHDGMLFAIVGVDGRARLHPLGPQFEIVTELERLRFSMRRAANAQASPGSLAAAVQAAEFGASHLDGLLLSRFVGELGDRPLVIVPTSVMHAVPWSILPSCQGRPLTVAPSATMWLTATTAPGPPEPGRCVFVAGPRLDHAEEEVRTLAFTYNGARQLIGADATCAAVCAAMESAELVHIASHGRFRADNPLFSCLELADGQLTVYDLERLRRPPRTLVLSSCDSGISDVRPGDELMGLAAALLSLGTQALVASVVPVPDDATRSLMLAFHAELRAGATVSTALAAAQGQCRLQSAGALVACAGFVSFGAG